MGVDAVDLLGEIDELIDEMRGDALSLLKRLIGTPSPSGHEEEAAGLLEGEMRGFGFDAVRSDEMSNVMATIGGIGGGRSILLNGHLDHVPPGGMVDPYSGKVLDGGPFGVDGEVIYGRGASDMKGAVAAMAMAGAVLKRLPIRLRGDYKVAAVSQEETGGAGTQMTIWRGHFLGDLVVVGEATNLELSLGHKGRYEVSIHIKGRSSHASSPDRGINALYKAASLIGRLRTEVEPMLPEHPIFGRTTMAVTRLEVKPNVSNVIPDECDIYIDCRNGPDYPAEAMKRALEDLISKLRGEDPELDALVIPLSLVGGHREFTGFYTDPMRYPVVEEIRSIMAEALGRQPRLTTWRFSTDGRFYSWLGIPVVGFGPGEERFAHTDSDHVRVQDYLTSIKAYAYLACRFCGYIEK
jgi:putative selenium metabolism hydrolase